MSDNKLVKENQVTVLQTLPETRILTNLQTSLSQASVRFASAFDDPKKILLSRDISSLALLIKSVKDMLEIKEVIEKQELKRAFSESDLHQQLIDTAVENLTVDELAAMLEAKLGPEDTISKKISVEAVRRGDK